MHNTRPEDRNTAPVRRVSFNSHHIQSPERTQITMASAVKAAPAMQALEKRLRAELLIYNQQIALFQ